jgi:hypothetical protein
MWMRCAAAMAAMCCTMVEQHGMARLAMPNFALLL